MIIAKKILPIVLLCSLSFNFSASCEELVPQLIGENEAGDSVIIFDEDLENSVKKQGFVDTLKKHKRAILIGLGCVVVVSAGAIVYRGQISDFFQKHMLGQKNDKKEKDDTEPGKNDGKGSGTGDGNSGDGTPDNQGQLSEQGSNPENTPPVVDNHDDLGEQGKPLEKESDILLSSSDNVEYKPNIFETKNIENVVSDFFQKDEEEVQKKHEEAVALSKSVQEQMKDLDKALSKKKPVITPPNKHSGFSGVIPSFS